MDASPAVSRQLVDPHVPIAGWKRRLPGVVGGISIALLIAGLVLNWFDRGHRMPPGAAGWGLVQFTNVIADLGVPILGILIARKSPSNSIGWLFLVAGSSVAVEVFSGAYAAHAIYFSTGWPLGYFAGWLGNTSFPIALAMLVLLLALFPTGRPLTRRWRAFVIADLVFYAFVMLVVGVVSLATIHTPFANSPTPPPGVARTLAQIFPIVFFGIPFFLLLALISAFLRFRRSRGEERQQMKWFTFAALFVFLTFAVNSSVTSWVQVASNVAILGLWIAIGIAMLKYRLYDVDVVIRKTLVGGLLVAFVTIVYVVVVAGIGALGSQYSFFHSGPLIAAATAIIAIAFQPVLRRARHLANRLVYGDRATPYEVLSEFSERMGGTVATNDIPQKMATIVGEGTGATGATVWLYVGGELRPDAVWPEDAVFPEAVRVAANTQDLSVPDSSRTFPVRHQDELLGALSVVMPPQEPLVGEQEKLCFDLAAQAGLVLRNVLLIEELHASRQRLVAAGDEERRKLERNIHDGAQQQLVALAIKIRLAKSLTAKDTAKSEALLDEVAAEAADALDNLRDLARGIYPPLLADKGLAAAVSAQAKKSPIPVTVAADGLGRYPQEAEAAVYFCVLEGLQNIGKYAEASAATVTLSQTNGTLAFEVADDGKGFDPASAGYGTGLQGIADRLAAMDGTLSVNSEPGKGTSLTGWLPVTSIV